MDEKERKAFEGDAQAQCDMGDDYFFEAFDADIENKDVLYRKQHFTTFTPPRKLMKLVYTRPELSPLDFLRFGP